MDKETLFSLELVVESLKLTHVTCRFPAVAFRLLDFPTLVIYHVEPDLSEAITKKISIGSYKVPPQLQELQDRKGMFQIKKGKSCLFKVSPNAILSHLQNTPLYVMILDTYPTTPKLVGNCTIPLDLTMNALYDDISKTGISIPSSHGRKDTLKVFNLMGNELGEISIGYRILSLGVGLLSHIPDKAIAKVGQKQSQVTRQYAKPLHSPPKPKTMQEEATSIILEDLETIDQNIQVVLSTPRPAQTMMHTQTEIEDKKMIGTQTLTRARKKKKEKNHIMIKDNSFELSAADDIVITNVECPPPLFYNSETDPKPAASDRALQLIYKQYNQAASDDSDVSGDSFDSNETIREEDRFSESELIIKPAKQEVKEVNVDVKHKENKKAKHTKLSQKSDPLGDLASFPLLSALMSEIVSLNSGGTENVATPHLDTRYIKSPRSPRKTPRVDFKTVAAKPVQNDHSSPVSDGQRRTVKVQIKSEPPNKSKESQQKFKSFNTNIPMSVKKTKITPGMTNTQRLRLAKTNPVLLEKMEKEEHDRVEKYKMRRRELGEGFEVNAADISTEISKHPSASETSVVHNKEQYQSYARHVPKLDLGHMHKRPVPTPRQSIRESYDEEIVVRELPPVTPRVSKQKKYFDNGNYSENGSEDSQTARSHIDVHLPSAAEIDNDDYYYQSDHSDHDIDNNKPINNPGFPKNVIQSTESMQYSDDFEDHHDEENDSVLYTGHDNGFAPKETYDAAEMLGLKRLVDTFSDDNSDEKNISNGVEVLGLRKMVDVYSDEEKSNSKENSYFGSEPKGLKQVVDEYSESEASQNSQSFHSAGSDFHQDSPKHNMVTSVVKAVAPSTSTMSPVVANKHPSLTPMRNAMDATSSSIDDSTAYIRRSEMASGYSSIESTGGMHDALKSSVNRAFSQRPNISPRKSLDRMRTESVSSYAPSDEDMDQDFRLSHVTPLSPQPEYSDNFESLDSADDVPNVKQMSDAQLAPEAKFGYTWSGY